MKIGLRWKKVTVLLQLLGASTVLWAQSGGSSLERYLFDAANRERREQGLPALKWNGPLAAAARAHAKEMARHDEVSHRLSGEPSLPSRAAHAGAYFTWLSENVVKARSAAEAHTQFVKSPAHRANLLDRDMNLVGIGAVERGGQLFVVQDFAQKK
jgi:uncharacterized protein YkwD